MPGKNGIEATREICATTTAKVLVLTMFDLDEYVYDAVRAGASGFLLKDIRRDELAHAVRTVHSGEALLAPAATRRLLEDLVRRPAHGVAPRLAARLTH
jgi:DNA-binding NarL/FixJ family response regulator